MLEVPDYVLSEEIMPMILSARERKCSYQADFRSEEGNVRYVKQARYGDIGRPVIRWR